MAGQKFSKRVDKGHDLTVVAFFYLFGHERIDLMANLLRLSKVNETPGFPLRASTLYKWVHVKKHPELFVRLGGAVYVNLDKLDAVISKGGTK